MAKAKKEKNPLDYHFIIPERIVNDEVSEFLQECLDYDICSNCEDFVREVRTCQVCSDEFCNDCADEHTTEETGLWLVVYMIQ